MKRFTKAIVALMLTLTALFAAGCTKPEDPNGGNNVSGTYNGHTFVDLGLPSGTLWATCNVGADTPEDYGDYFAWGETMPKDYYDWSTYQYCTGGYYEYPFHNMFTKYCSKILSGYNGFTDDLNILLPEDDAATANWGTGWRLPTEAEWWELYYNTTGALTSQNGVYGLLFTAANGNSLFLPAAGWRHQGGLNYPSDDGLYWSSLLDRGYPEDARGFAFSFSFYTVSYYVGSGYRSGGRSVRAVHVGSQN